MKKASRPVSRGVWKRRKSLVPLSKKASSNFHSTLRKKGRTDYPVENILVNPPSGHTGETLQP